LLGAPKISLYCMEYNWPTTDVELVSGGQCGWLVTVIIWFISGWCIWYGKWCKELEDVGLGLVERRPWCVCLRCPLMVASEEGQCFIALQRVRPGKVCSCLL
jgi:hypothetical protein